MMSGLKLLNRRWTKAFCFIVLGIAGVSAIVPSTAWAEADAPPTQAEAGKTAVYYVPKVENGVVTLELTDPKSPDRFHQAIQFTGEGIWNNKPNAATLPGNLEISGPALIACGSGKGEAAFFFTITPDMEVLRFFVLGNSDRLNRVTLFIDGKEWSYKGVETSSKVPEKTEWKLSGKENAGKVARIVFTKSETSADGYLALVSTPDAVKDKPKPEVKPVVIAPYHVESTYVRTVGVTLTISFRIPEVNGNGKVVKFFLPRPPDLHTQQFQGMAFRCVDYPQLKPFETKDYLDPNHSYLCIEVPVSAKTSGRTITVEGKYTLDLYKSKLVRGSDRRKSVVKLAGIPSDSMGIYLQESSRADFNNPFFKDWIVRNGLVKQDNEDTVAFAFRVYRFMCQNGQQVEAFEPLFPKASESCTKNNLRFGMCGDTANFFTAIMGYNKIPAMTNSGRWANSSTSTAPQYHVKSSFYCSEINDWVEVDPTLGVCSKNNLYFSDSDFLITLAPYLDCMPEKQGYKGQYCQSIIVTYQGKFLYVPGGDSWQVDTVR